MSDNDKVAKVTLQYVVDTNSVNKVAQSTADLKSQVNSLGQSTADLAVASQTASKSYQGAWANAAGSIKAADDQLQQYMDDISKTAELNKLVADPFGDGSGGGGGNGGGGSDGGGGVGVNGLRRSGAILNRAGLGVIGQPLQITGEALQLNKTFEGITGSFKGIVDAGGPATDIVRDMGGDLGVLAVSGGAALVAVAGIVAVVGVFKSELDTGSKGLVNAVTYVDDYYKAIEKGTTDSLQAQIKAAEIEQGIEQEKVKTLQAAYDAAHAIATPTDGETADAFGAIKSGIYDLSAGGKAANKDLEDTTKALSDTTENIAAMKAALDSTEVATNNAAAAELELQKIRDQNAEKVVATARQDAQLISSGSSKSVESTIADLQTARKALTDLDFSKLSPEEAGKLKQEWTDLYNQEQDLTNNVLPLIKAREDEAAAIKDLNKGVEDAQKARDAVAQKEVDSVTKLNTAIESANATADQAKIAANQKLQDALVKAAENAVAAADKALDQLHQKQAANLDSLNQDLSKEDRAAAATKLNDQIKEQQQERDDLQQHLQNLQQIRDADAGRQRDDQLNRNFRDLFALSEQKTQQMNSENTRYTTQEAQRRQALGTELSDLQRSQNQQRQERIVAYNQANADAQKQYNTAIQQADVARKQAIDLAKRNDSQEIATINKNNVDKLAALRAGTTAELKLITQTEQARQQIFQNMLNQARQMLGQSTSPTFGTPAQRSAATPFANGAGVYAGAKALVNEPGSSGNESFNGVAFPRNTMGLFYPLVAGNINSGKGGGNISIPITVNEAQNAQATAAALRPMVVDVVHKEILGQ